MPIHGGPKARQRSGPTPYEYEDREFEPEAPLDKLRKHFGRPLGSDPNHSVVGSSTIDPRLRRAVFSSARLVPNVLSVGRTPCSRNSRGLMPAPESRSRSW